MKRFFASLMVFGLTISYAVAQTAAPAVSLDATAGLAAETATLKKFHESPPPGCADKYVLLSGENNGTYSQIANDIKKIEDVGKFFCIVQTQGGYNNAILLAKNLADVGMVQVDGLDLVGRYDSHVGDLRSLVSLFPAAMHIVVMQKPLVLKKASGWNGNDETRTLSVVSDLRDLPVAVWSSAVVTARNLNDASNLNMRLVTVQTIDEGIGLLHEGKVAAFIGMGGRPVGWVEKLDRSHRLLGLSAEINQMMDKFPKSGYTKDSLSYDNLGQVGVSTIASQVEMVVQNLKSSRGANLLQFRDALSNYLDDIREKPGAHQAWKLVSDHPELTVWPRYEGPRAKAPLKTQAPTAVPNR